MATSSILGGDRVPNQPMGTDVDSLGPSDTSDSGADARGAFDSDELQSDTDAGGTGERASVKFTGRSAGDILPDHVERMPADGEGDSEVLLDEEGSPIDVESLAADDSEDDEDLPDDLAG